MIYSQHKIRVRKSRVLKIEESQQIVYIKHLGVEPYNEIKFDCGKILIVSYSLAYWHTIFQNFERINKGVLINPNKIIGNFGEKEVQLTDKSIFTYSRRGLLRYRHTQNTVNVKIA